MTKFQIGQTYTTRSACDYECIFSFTVVKRTNKFITITDNRGNQKRAGIFLFDENIEHCFPDGRYSMAPVISAS